MTTTSRPAPVLFISHGAPTFALEPGLLGPQLNAIGRQLAGKVKAVLMVSPHWQTRDIQVMGTAEPDTVHDFGGFPARLYTLRYPAKGHAASAALAQQLLNQAGWSASLDATQGMDHGAWVPMMHLFPQADVPVFQVSMPYGLDAAGAARFGQALSKIRDSGVMIVTSGAMTHNLYEFRQSSAATADYAIEFTHWTRQAVVQNDLPKLVNYRNTAPHAHRAHPTDEHYLPLMIAMGALRGTEELSVLDGGITYGVISMESYAWGLPQALVNTPATEESVAA